MRRYKKLIEAAKKIDSLGIKQERRAKAWQQLAIDAKKPDADRMEIERRRNELVASGVIDFGNAIEELRQALKDI